jgi:hypothetical protein
LVDEAPEEEEMEGVGVRVAVLVCEGADEDEGVLDSEGTEVREAPDEADGRLLWLPEAL